MVPTGAGHFEETGSAEEKIVPTLDMLYDQIPASYEQLAQRLEAMEKRLQDLMLFSTSFLLPGPAIVVLALNPATLQSNFFYLATVLALLNLVIGTINRFFTGKLLLPQPQLPDSPWAKLTERQFKTESLRYAHFNGQKNSELVNSKGNWAAGMTVVFLAEISVLIAWWIVDVSRYLEVAS